MSEPNPASDDRETTDAGLLPRLRRAALGVPGLRAVLSAMDAGLGEILVVALLLISVPLALMLVVGAFQFGGLPGGSLLLAAVIAALVVWLARRRPS